MKVIRSVRITLHEMGTGVHEGVWVNVGQDFPPQLEYDVTVRVLVFTPLLALHFPGGATQGP